MSHVKVIISRCCVVFALLALVISVASCNKSPEKPTATEAAQKTFASPDDAGKALVEAAKAGSHDALIAIFGPGSQDVIFSGDTAQDKTNFDNFTAAYATMNRWRKSLMEVKYFTSGPTIILFPSCLRRTAQGNGTSTLRPEKTRFFRGVSATTNWPRWMCLRRWPPPKPNTFRNVTTA